MIKKSKTEELQRTLNLYITQQRKTHLVIYTNDSQMKQLLKQAHPNITVELLNPPLPKKTRIKGELFTDYFGYPNPLIFKPYYRSKDKPMLNQNKE